MKHDDEHRADIAARLAERLADPASPRSVVLRGPAGIGKTHLARDIAARIGDLDVTVRRVAGGEAQQHLAFGALLHLLSPNDVPVGVEFELVLRLRSAIVEQSRPTVLVVDDVGLLDDRSAGLIESLLHSGDVTMLATERTPLAGPPPEHALSHTLRDECDIAEIDPMSDAEMARLLVEWAGPGEVGSIRRLTAMCRGNPLVLREMLAAARASNAVGERGGLWFLADFRAAGHSLDRLVREHLDRLPSEVWELLQCVAVAGALPRSLAARVDVDSLESLERLGLLSGDPSVVGHPLYGEVIRASMTGEQVRRVCGKLVASVGPDDAVDAARLGEWLLEADYEIDDGAARSGARVALARWENVLARRLVEAIVEPAVSDLVMLVWTHANVGDLDAADRAAERAVAAADSDLDRVEATLARSELWALQMSRGDESHESMVALKDHIADQVLIARIDGAIALYSQMTGRRDLAVSAVESASAARLEAIEHHDADTGAGAADPAHRAEHEGALDGDRPGDGVDLAVSMAAAFGRVFAGQFVAAEQPIADGLRLAESVAERHNWVRIQVAAAIRSLMVGDLGAAHAVVDEMLGLADISGVRPAHVVWLGLASQIAQVEGAFGLAERRAREAVRAGDHVDDFGAGGFVRGDLSALLIELGHSTELDPRSSPIGLARARVRLADPAVVDDLAAELATNTADAGYLLWAPWVTREAIRRVDAPRCTALLAAWADDFDGDVVRGFALHGSGVVERDISALDEAIAIFEHVGFIVPSIDARMDAVAMEVETDGASPGIRRRLLEAHDVVRRLTPTAPGPLVAELDRLDALVEMPSQRQLEIARLVAHGLTSKEVAAELVVSARTVDNHLAAVYRSLDLAGRNELSGLFS